jgi:hypothetical protein
MHNWIGDGAGRQAGSWNSLSDSLAGSALNLIEYSTIN